MVTDEEITLKIRTGDRYEALVLKDPKLYAVREPVELPEGHQFRVPAGPTHELTLQGSCFRNAGSADVLGMPDQAAALWFVSGKGSQRTLGHPPSREYCWVEDRVYLRATREEAGLSPVSDGGRRRSRRGGLHLRRDGLLRVYLIASPIMNDPAFSDEVERGLSLLMRRVVG